MNQRLPAPLSDERLDVWAEKETQTTPEPLKKAREHS